MKKGFTLAEIIITLGVIGIVAALTIPVLITKHRNKVYQTQFKVANYLVSQAVERLALDCFDINEYYCGTENRDSKDNVFILDFSKYFQVVKRDYTNQTGNLKNLGYKKTSFNLSTSGDNNFNQDFHNNGAIFLRNDMMIASSGCLLVPTYVDFIVDTNGTKGPNKLGYDVFYFQIGDNNKLYPLAGNYHFFIPNNNSDILIKNCCNFKEATCTIPQDTGLSCALYAMRNASPYDSTKGYWESLP